MPELPKAREEWSLPRGSGRIRGQLNSRTESTRMQNQALEQIERTGLVPVIAMEDPELAVPLARALAEGEIPVIELTFRTSAAADAIARIRRECPDVLAGAGTVRTPDQVRQAHQAGARFIVAPGFNPDVAQACAALQLPFVPGVVTPTEIDRALLAGCQVLKFFPAEPSGGIEMLKALAAPFRHTGVKFLPTGGIREDNFAAYLALDIVTAVGGTWIAPAGAIARQEWASITKLCRQAREIARTARG